MIKMFLSEVHLYEDTSSGDIQLLTFVSGTRST